VSSYHGAQGHYLSARRRDPVKVLMEEVVSHEIFAGAVRRLGLPPAHPLRVLDLGSGTGDGVALLSEPHGDLAPIMAGRGLSYLGLDADAEMVATAASLHRSPGIEFAVGDMRDGLPEDAFDLYLSCGVPYSHLTAAETEKVLTTVFRQIARNRRRAAVVVDVLGRFSVEWTPNWASTRWNYAMSFFEDVADRIEETMTFHDRGSLSAVIASAADRAGVRPLDVTFTDRSVLVGRHTATRSFNPSIPPYRSLVNELARGSSSVDVEQLRFTAPRTGAPDPVLAFFAAWERDWNAIVAVAGPLRSVGQARSLGSALLRHERTMTRGLGTGHSLTATVTVAGS
jgi:SAM-dependent methyltransferase